MTNKSSQKNNTIREKLPNSYRRDIRQRLIEKHGKEYSTVYISKVINGERENLLIMQEAVLLSELFEELKQKIYG